MALRVLALFKPSAKVLDFLAPEVLKLDNVVLTPHVSWYTADTMRRYLKFAPDNCRRLPDGRELANVVNGIVFPNRPVNRETPSQ